MERLCDFDCLLPVIGFCGDFEIRFTIEKLADDLAYDWIIVNHQYRPDRQRFLPDWFWPDVDDQMRSTPQVLTQ